MRYFKKFLEKDRVRLLRTNFFFLVQILNLKKILKRKLQKRKSFVRMFEADSLTRFEDLKFRQNFIQQQ